MFKRCAFVVLLIPQLLITCFSQSMKSETSKVVGDCKYWQAKVDHSLQVAQNVGEKDKRDPTNVMEAIACLLQLKGNSTPTQYGAAISLKLLEAKLPKPTVEIAALNKISALYFQNRNHAEAIVLVDERGNQNTKESIEKAYRAYESWFERVKEIGLEKARNDGLNPLDGTSVHWY